MSRPIRFTFIILSAAAGTVLAALGGWRYARASAPLSGPIIVISIDTLRADHLPTYGYKKVRTPALDALAADGVVFERMYAHATETLPAHAALLSGRLPFESGVRGDTGPPIKPGERLLAQMLRDRGYATAGVVSSVLLRGDTGIGRGFEFFDSDLPAPVDSLAAPSERNGAASERIAERWLATVGSSRAFLFLHLNEPHKPYAPPERFAEYAPYDGEIAYSDEIVARLVKYLKSHQLYDRSTIVVVSDHGEGLGDHGEQQHGLFVYDEALHVPLIVKQESNVRAGTRVKNVVQHIDLVPTILDLVKAPVPGNLRGRSLKPLLEGTGQIAETAVYSEAPYGHYAFGWSELTALTGDRYRYIRAPREELYDLRRDPKERENLSEDRGQVVRTLRRALERLVLRPSAPAIEPPADPKDKYPIVETYRTAMDLAGERKWSDAIAALQQIVREDPALPVVWQQLAAFAARIDRLDLAIDASRHYIALKPSDPAGYLGIAAALFRQRKLEEAQANAERGVDAAAEQDVPLRIAAYQLLARIALARHDADAARQQAALAREADPNVPLAPYVQARLLYDQGKYADALPFLAEAIAAQRKSGGAPFPDLHYYAGDTLDRLDRDLEAEAEYLAELHDFPQNVRARAALATLYHTMARDEEAARVVSDMTEITPTPESYALAARLWTALGNRQQADIVRAEARRLARN